MLSEVEGTDHPTPAKHGCDRYCLSQHIQSLYVAEDAWSPSVLLYCVSLPSPEFRGEGFALVMEGRGKYSESSWGSLLWGCNSLRHNRRNRSLAVREAAPRTTRDREGKRALSDTREN